MTKPIRATRENLNAGTIWQNAAGNAACRILATGQRTLTVTSFTGNPHNVTIGDFLKLDVWYKVQPIKEPAHEPEKH